MLDLIIIGAGPAGITAGKRAKSSLGDSGIWRGINFNLKGIVK